MPRNGKKKTTSDTQGVAKAAADLTAAARALTHSTGGSKALVGHARGMGSVPRGGHGPPARSSAAAGVAISRSALVAAHYVACPDELPSGTSGDLPLVPDRVGGVRSNLIVTSQESSLNLSQHNKLVVAAGQHTYAAIIASVTDTTTVGVNRLLMIDISNQATNFSVNHTPVTTNGAPTSFNRTKFVHGFLMSTNSSSVEPPFPTPRRYYASVKNTPVIHVAAGSNKIGYFRPSSASASATGDMGAAVDVLLIGYAAVVSGVVSLFADYACTVPLTVTPIIPTTGNDVLEMVVATDPQVDRNSGSGFYPYREICTNVKLASLLSYLESGASVKAYRMIGVGGRTIGSYMRPLSGSDFPDTGDPAASNIELFATDAYVNLCARQINTGYIKSGDKTWPGINVASRMVRGALEDGYQFSDLSATAETNPNPTILTVDDSTSSTYEVWQPSLGASYQNDWAVAHIDCPGVTTVPLIVSAKTWLDLQTSNVSGLTHEEAVEDPEYGRTIAAFIPYPCMAPYNSFSDFWRGVIGVAKKAAGTIRDKGGQLLKTTGMVMLDSGAAILKEVAHSALADAALLLV